MLKRSSLIFAFLLSARAFAQAGAGVGGDQSPMMVPPILSGGAYADEGSGETRSNYLSFGAVFTTAYEDDTALGGTEPVSDFSFQIRPTIALSKTVPRQNLALGYSPGFTFYTPTSGLNQADQNASGSYEYRLSPHITADLRDQYYKSSNAFDQPGAITGGPVTGSPQPEVVVAPFASQWRNTASGELTYQFSENGMIGGGGTSMVLNYPNPAQVPGLYDMHAEGGSAFFTQRFGGKQYIGFNYDFSRTIETPLGTQDNIQSQSFAAFFSFYPQRSFSISLSGGPEYVSASQTSPNLSARSWSPSGSAGLGWQGSHASVAAGFSRVEGGGGGLLGAYTMTGVHVMAHWEASRTWSLGASGAYQVQNAAIEGFETAGGGHTLAGEVMASRAISRLFSVDFRYDRLHQSYAGVAALAAAPDTNRESVSVAYHFSKALGR